MNNKNTSFKIKVLVLTILFFTKSWGQVTIASDGFNNSSLLFSTNGGEYFNGNSGSGDLPRNSPFSSEGTHSYGVNNGTATLTSKSDINTSGYSSVTMSIRLAAFSIGSTGNGVESDDIVTVEVSPDGGTIWYNTMRVSGESNACWSFIGGKNASTAYNGNVSPAPFKPNSGGELTSNGYSTITITNLPSVLNLRFRITLSNDSNREQWLIDDFKVTGIVSCTPPVLSTIFPNSGPVGTEVVITASSGDLTGATASFGGIAATVVSTSTTQMTILVPIAATGSLTIKNSVGCIVPVAFTVLKEDKTSCGSGTGSFSDLIISEVYDSNSNNVWHMELFNPTAAPIDLAASNYKFEIYQTKGDPSSLSRTVILSGIVLPGKVFLANLGDSGAPCSKTFDFAESSQGINDDDQIRLTKNGVLVDVVNCPATKGYTIERKPTAIGPKTVYAASDWTTLATESCTDLGVFPYTPSPPPIISSPPTFTPSCSNIVFSVTANEGVVGGNSLAYQWYFAAPNSSSWIAVTDGGVYNGATTSMLAISSISGLLGYQFYCQVRENAATCSSASNAVKISSSAVAAPTLTKTDSSCTSTTGSIEVTAPVGTGITYSLDGTTYQSSPIFSSLSPKSYNVTVKNSSGCVSLPATETIATTSTPLAPTLTKTDSSCTSSTGSIEVTAPVGTGFTYSIDGTSYQPSPIFINLSPKSYNVTVKNSSGCVSLPAIETISTVSRIDPINSVQYLCFDKTGLIIAPITIDTKLSPTEYSFVWTFAGNPISATSSSYVATAVGMYKITATSKAGGCTILFNADVKESKEAIAVATVGNDFGTQQQIIVTVTGGLGNYEYQLDDGLPQNNPILSVSKSGDYTVKVIDKLGCNNFLLSVNVLNYPRFFTPNNDGYNDTWNIEGLNKPEKATIYIFDRYGKLLKQISPAGKGWDGVYNGVAQPASDYWFRLLYQDSIGANKEFKAHFSLKR